MVVMRSEITFAVYIRDKNLHLHYCPTENAFLDHFHCRCHYYFPRKKTVKTVLGKTSHKDTRHIQKR
jgi:hypothetical protein